ncbi:hypothetical protein RRG08_012714 [Elysia crispata]|uniref:Uncharacterized protein n=1 Tax=Elysia crispata TaxID=231223 RepID=A0AAE1DNP3_9GAST|nr:hypothetical protein RRG08_012714 [Elysia crispata]
MLLWVNSKLNSSSYPATIHIALCKLYTQLQLLSCNSPYCSGLTLNSNLALILLLSILLCVSSIPNSSSYPATIHIALSLYPTLALILQLSILLCVSSIPNSSSYPATLHIALCKLYTQL